MAEDNVVQFPEPKEPRDILDMARETGSVLEQMLGKVMELAPEGTHQNVSACLTNAQVRLVECMDWIAHAISHASAGVKK